MPKFEIITREIVRTRYTVVTTTIGQAKRLFLNNEATKQSFEVEETLSAWIVAPDSSQTPLDDVEEAFIFPLSTALGGGRIVVMASSLAEALAKVDEEIKGLAAPAAPPAPKSIAIKNAAESVSIPVRGVMSDKQLADATQPGGEIHAVDRDGPVRDLVISIRSGMIAVGFVSAEKGTYHIVVNGEGRRVYNLPSGKRIRDLIDGVFGAKNLVSVDFMPDKPGAHMHKVVIVEVTLPPIPPVSTWTKPSASAPRAFEYLRVKPCLEDYDGEIQSFNSEEERNEAVKGYTLQLPRMFYTLYGVEPGGYEMAIGDFTLKADALEVMNAILAPMAKARDALSYGTLYRLQVSSILERAEETTKILDDFINQCSNGERA